MSISRFPVALSFAGHAAALGLIIWFSQITIPPLLQNTIDVVFVEEFLPAAPANEAETAGTIASPLAELRSSPRIDHVAPKPEPASPAPARLDTPGPTPGTDLSNPEAQQSQPHFPKAEAQPPAPAKPRHRVDDRRPKPKPPQRRRPEPGATAFVPAPAPLPVSPSVAAIEPQIAAVPLATPQRPVMPTPSSPEVSAAYRSALSAWLERHKKYPTAARQRGEQGSVVLQFRVDREGRVLSYTLLRRSGYPELDRAVDDLMQNPRLPPFPASMTQPDIEVAVTIRFGLTP